MYIDVREKDEWDAGHLEGARHIPLSRLHEGDIPADLPTDEPIYIYCAKGGRARVAKGILVSTYPLVENLTCSFEELVALQRPDT